MDASLALAVLGGAALGAAGLGALAALVDGRRRSERIDAARAGEPDGLRELRAEVVGLRAEWATVQEHLEDLADTVERRRRRAAASAAKAGATLAEPEQPAQMTRADWIAIARRKVSGS